jgi:hypothetical protein
MERLEYRYKLIQFNNTEKYRNELHFLSGLIDSNGSQKIIDYGCGIGTAVKYFNNINSGMFYGFDIVNYTNDDCMVKPAWFLDEVIECNTIYFIHSFAHIPDISRLLLDLRSKVKNKIVVITPNAQWLRLQQDENYKPDPTVVMHYTNDELIELFEDAGYTIKLSGGFGTKINNQYERLFLVANT